MAKSIEDEIVDWAVGRPGWQRLILRDAARGQRFDPSQLVDLVERVVGTDPPESFAATDFNPPVGNTKDVVLLALRDVVNANALRQTSPLTFGAAGITLVFGDNGSGKSGYARLIKRAVRSRHSERVLPDVYTKAPSTPPSAVLVADVGGTKAEFRSTETPVPELQNVAFFDTACSNAYVTDETDVQYRPPQLVAMDELIRACDEVTKEIDARLERNAAGTIVLPALVPGTDAHKFAGSLSADTTESEVEAACRLPENANAELTQLVAEIARLAETNPELERKRLTALVSELTTIIGHLQMCDEVVGEPGVAAIDAAAAALNGARSAVQMIAQDEFPRAGVGGEAWATLWRAARAFVAETDAAEPFPPADPRSTCPLCQEELQATGVARLRRFEELMTSVGQDALKAAQDRWEVSKERLIGLEPVPTVVVAALAKLAGALPACDAAVRAALESIAKRRESLILSLRSDPWSLPAMDPVPDVVEQSSRYRAELTERAKNMDVEAFGTLLRTASAGRDSLQSTIVLASRRGDLLGEVVRLRERRKLLAAKESALTTTVTRKASELVREFAVSRMVDQFKIETSGLRLQRVQLADQGGRKGLLHVRAQLDGAVQQAPTERVLSEGEQNALGLAGFFTEVALSASRSSVVLDDPVSSLDHLRKRLVAERLVDLAKLRPVIVFTHDIGFLSALAKAADKIVQLTPRWVDRHPGGASGRCADEFPWKASDAKQRCHALRVDLARIERERGGWDSERAATEVANWAGRLSETWEQLLKDEIAGRLVDREKLEVRPKMIKILSGFTPADEDEFNKGYGWASTWAPRHDKPVELATMLPDRAELEREVSRVDAFRDRLKKLAN